MGGSKQGINMLTKLGFHKTADIVIGPSKDPRAKMTSAGMFIGTEDAHAEKAKLLQELITKHRRLGAIRDAYTKTHPDDFVTGAFKYELEPKKPFLFGMGKYKKDLADYQERSSNPRIFVTVGRAGSPGQAAFYNEVIRGKHERELGKKD